jgi:hypothetical protein
MKFQQKNLDQTGVAVLSVNEEEKIVPLYSLQPVEEAMQIADSIRDSYKDRYVNVEIKNVYITNNLMETKIEDIIEKYRISYPNTLPEDYMEELLSGFPYILGNEPHFTKAYYA